MPPKDCGLSPGERGVVICIGADQVQARVQRDYIEGAIDTSPLLAPMVANRTADAIELRTGIAVETAFWMDSETGSSNADAEILAAVRPTLATTGGPLVMITTPYAKRDETWATFQRHFGKDGDPLVLVARADSRTFNPTLPQRIIDRALERDPSAARAEYLAEFRDDIEAFISRGRCHIK